MSVAAPVVEEPPVAKPEDDAVRNYLFVALSALLVVVLVLMRNASGNLIVLVGVVPALLGLFLRWTAMPGVFLVTLTYLQLFPSGLPVQLNNSNVTIAVPFRMHDFLLLGATVVYFVCQFRLFSLTVQAVPSDRLPIKQKATDRPIRRNTRSVNTDELYRLFFVVTACVLLAQVTWFVLTIVVIEPSVFPPIRFVSPNSASAEFKTDAGSLNRFLFLIGLVGSIGLGFGFVFWYRSLQRMQVEHAKMFMLDTAWRETRSELSRQEKWRAWGQGNFHAVSGHAPRQERGTWILSWRSRRSPYYIRRSPTGGPSIPVKILVFILLFLVALLFGSVLISSLR